MRYVAFTLTLLLLTACGDAAPAASYAYDESARTVTVTDPAGKKTRTLSDALGRTLYSVENYVNFSASGGVGSETGTGGSSNPTANANADQDRVTRYAYNALGQQTALTALDPDADGSLADNQTTLYLYEDDYNASLLTSTIFPDSADTTSTGGDQVKTAYALDGQPATRTDQRGVVFTFGYDKLRRPVAQRTTTLAADADGAIRSIGTAYDTRGRRDRVTSYSDFDTTLDQIVNEVAYTYTDFGALASEYQEHDGAVTLTGPTASPSLSYTYDTTAASGVYTNAVRLQGYTLPNGRSIGLAYTGPGDVAGQADALSAPTALVEWSGTGTPTRGTTSGGDANVIASFDRTAGGTGTTIAKRYPTPQIELDLRSPGSTINTGDAKYASLDRHGRIKRLHWRDTSTATTSSGPYGSVFDIEYAYDINSNRTLARNHRYGSDSHLYAYDRLDRLVDDKRGKLDAAGTDIPGAWRPERLEWTLDALGNQLGLTRRGALDSRLMTHNKANEIQTLAVRGDAASPRFGDEFDSSASASDWTALGSETWSFGVSSAAVAPTPVADTLQGNAESQARAITLLGDDIGPHMAYLHIHWPANATTGEVGYVFGYKSANDYWLQVADLGDDRLGYYHVVNGDKGTMLAQSTINLDASSLVGLTHKGTGDSVSSWPWPTLDLSDAGLGGGYPSGRVGLYSTVAGATFDFVRVWDEANPQPSTPRWEASQAFTLDKATDALRYSATTWWKGEYRVKGVRASRFEATFSVTRAAPYTASGVFLGFGGGRLELRNHATATAPVGHDGPVNVTSNASAMPSVASGVPLWFRVSSDGTTLRVRAATSEAGLASAGVCWSGDYDVTGEELRFSPHTAGVAGIDDVTLKTDRDADGTFETTELVERFTLDATGHAQDTLEYDAAGNLTYDGVFRYTYDAWNRQTKVTKAYRDDNGVLQLGSVVQQNQYDGTGRRIVVEVKNSGDLDHTEHVFYDGWSQVETRNGSGIVTKQMTWAGRVGGYIDELLQIAHNLDWPDALPAADQNCEAKYWAMQDANYNVLGIVDDEGKLVERYEYTPYGERTVYRIAGGNDPAALAYVQHSQHVILSDNSTTCHLLNLHGHQGLERSAIISLTHNRSRIASSSIARFLQRDPLGYVEGAQAYLYLMSNPLIRKDSLGTRSYIINDTHYSWTDSEKRRVHDAMDASFDKASRVIAEIKKWKNEEDPCIKWKMLPEVKELEMRLTTLQSGKTRVEISHRTLTDCFGFCYAEDAFSQTGSYSSGPYLPFISSRRSRELALNDYVVPQSGSWRNVDQARLNKGFFHELLHFAEYDDNVSNQDRMGRLYSPDLADSLMGRSGDRALRDWTAFSALRRSARDRCNAELSCDNPVKYFEDTFDLPYYNDGIGLRLE